MDNPEYVFATARPVPNSSFYNGTILNPEGAVLATGMSPLSVVDKCIKQNAETLKVVIVREESIMSPVYIRYWGRVKSPEPVSGTPCPDCKGTGQCVLLWTVGVCQKCQGRKVIA